MIGKQTIEEKWRQQSEAAQQQAKKLPYGKQREHLLRMAGSYKPHLKSMNGYHPPRCSRRSKTASIGASGRNEPLPFRRERPIALPLPQI